MNDAPPAPSLWIRGPRTDLFFFSFGWILAFGAFILADRTTEPAEYRTLLIVSILLFNFLHRHLTLPLVYGDPEQFRERRTLYLLLPALCLLLTLAAFFFTRIPEVESAPVAARAPMAQTAAQDFILWPPEKKPGEAPTRVRIHFGDGEATPQELAATLSRGLKDWIAVEAREDRLVYTLSRTEPGLQFTLGASLVHADLPDRLGLARRTWYGFPITRPLFALMLAAAVIWTIYHSIMQKVGLLRIYSRKAGAGISWVDKSMILAWFVFLVVHLGSMPAVREQAATATQLGRTASGILESAGGALTLLVLGALIVATGFTAAYVVHTARHRDRFSWPRTFYVLSILALYATFYYDMVAGYAVFAFSHAIEYIAFVNIYSGRKYAARPPESSFLARVVRRQVLCMTIYCLALIPAFLLLRWGAPMVLSFYIVGSGFLHFIYDGWIWKVRKAEVGKPLGIRYEAT